MPIFHDPRKAVDLLRNHLATHDHPLLFLFGAGSSSAVNVASSGHPHKALIPAVIELTSLCKSFVESKGDEYKKAWSIAVTECSSAGLAPNIETILSRVRAKIASVGSDDVTLGLKKEALIKLEGFLRESIYKHVSPAESQFPNDVPHDTFAQWVKHIKRKAPLELFTTNYDVLLERSLERARVPVFDGFVGSHFPYFSPECIEEDQFIPPPQWIRIWKLHGSINWRIAQINGQQYVVRDNSTTTGEMILPSHLKYDESRKQPYRSLLDRLHRALTRNSVLLVTSGFSFSDQHLNEVILNALDSNPLSHVISLQYDKLAESASITKLASKRPNFIVLGADAGVIGGQWGEWKLGEPISDAANSFMQFAFKPTPPKTAGDAALTGAMLLGDFSMFCRLLATMDGARWAKHE